MASLTTTSTSNGAGSGPITAAASLNGTGLTAPVLSMTPAALMFPATLLGQTSPTQLVTIENSGQTGISGLQLVVTPGFALDPTMTTCTATLNAGASCVAGVQFVPTGAGAQMGSLTAGSGSAGTTPATAALSGVGALPPGIVTMPAGGARVGTAGVGVPGQPMPLTITNQGSLAALTGCWPGAAPIGRLCLWQRHKGSGDGKMRLRLCVHEPQG